MQRKEKPEPVSEFGLGVQVIKLNSQANAVKNGNQRSLKLTDTLTKIEAKTKEILAMKGKHCPIFGEKLKLSKLL